MNKRIQVLGDSISLGYGLNKNDLSFVSLIEREYDVFVDVFALCGQTTFDLIKNLSERDSQYFDITIILIGTNGTLSYLEYMTLLDIVKKKSKKVIACTLPINSQNNDVIREETLKNQVVLCDLNNKWQAKYFLLDQIHPNQEGHFYIFKMISNIINTL